jgi:AcrR family transcriptional regulator
MPGQARPRRPVSGGNRSREADQDTTEVPIDGDGWRSRVVTRSLKSATNRALDRSEAFIRAAIELLQEKGEGFTLQEVADRTGLSLRLFYQHFDGKDDLLLAVLEEEYRVVSARHRAELAGEADPVQRLIRYLEQSVTQLKEHSAHNVALLKYELELMTTHPNEIARAQAPQTDFVCEMVAEGIAAGAWHPAGAEEGAYLVVSLKRAYNHSKLLGNELGVTMPDAHEFVRFCIEGLGGHMP